MITMIPKQVEGTIDKIREIIEYSEDDEFQEEIMEMGRYLEEYPQEKLIDECKLMGCISTVYIHAEFIDESARVKYYAYSNSDTVKGFLYILVKMLSGLKKEDIINLSDDLIEVLDIKGLSQSRIEGFKKAYLRMKELAIRL